MDVGTRQFKVGSLGHSNFVLSGSEDLGGGMAATFRLASRFNVDAGSQTTRSLFHEESTVGLSGALGSVRLGRGLTALWNTDWLYGPWYNFNRAASPAWQLYHSSSPSLPNSPAGRAPGTSGPTDEYAQVNNEIFYQSPVMGGFKLEVTAEVEKNLADTKARKRNLGSALTYSQSPITAPFAAERNSQDNKVYFAGTEHNFGSVTLVGPTTTKKRLMARPVTPVGRATVRPRWAQAIRWVPPHGVWALDARLTPRPILSVPALRMHCPSALI